MSKFTRVVKFKGDFNSIQHNGETFKEDHEGTGLLEVLHAHADHFVECGFVEEYAPDMETAMEKLTAAPEKQEAGQAAAAAKRGKL